LIVYFLNHVLVSFKKFGKPRVKFAEQSATTRVGRLGLLLTVSERFPRLRRMSNGLIRARKNIVGFYTFSYISGENGKEKPTNGERFDWQKLFFKKK
jgi:hypothetical protein